LFFARPSLRRRGYDVGVDALRLLKTERPDVDVVFFGSPTDELGEVPFEFRNLGVIEATAVAEAMNEAHILLTFSLTNISNVPYEGMACGCAVVDLDLPNVSSMVEPDVNCILAAFEPRALADAVERLTDDPDLRLRIARRGAADAAVRTWERTASMFEAALRRICFVTDPSLVEG
jgi:glycosyltransferase involved in cell wall biosynthesis